MREPSHKASGKLIAEDLNLAQRFEAWSLFSGTGSQGALKDIASKRP